MDKLKVGDYYTTTIHKSIIRINKIKKDTLTIEWIESKIAPSIVGNISNINIRELFNTRNWRKYKAYNTPLFKVLNEV